MVQPTVVSPGGAVHSILEPVAASISGDGVDASIAALRAAASGFPKRRLAHISGSTFDIDGKGSEIMPGYHESPVSSTAAQPPMTPQQQISSIPQMHNLEGEQLGGLHPRPRPSPSGARVFLPSPMRRQLDADFPKSSLPIALDIAGVQLHSDPLNTRVNSSLPREDFGVSSGNLSDPGPYPGTSTETVRPTALQRSGTYGSIRNRFFDEPPHQKRPNTSSHCRHQLNIVFPTDPERRMHDSPAPVSFDALHHSFPGSLPEYLIATGAADVEMRRNASVRSMVTTVSILSTPAGLFRGLKYLTKRSPRPNVRESMSSKRSSVATTKFPRSRGNSICGSVVSAAAAAALLAYADASGESNRNSLAEYATDAVNDFTIARAWLQQNPSLSNSLPRSRRCNELIEASLQRRLANGSMTTISVNEELLVEPRRKKVNFPKGEETLYCGRRGAGVVRYLCLSKSRKGGCGLSRCSEPAVTTVFAHGSQLRTDLSAQCQKKNIPIHKTYDCIPLSEILTINHDSLRSMTRRMQKQDRFGHHRTQS